MNGAAETLAGVGEVMEARQRLAVVVQETEGLAAFCVEDLPTPFVLSDARMDGSLKSNLHVTCRGVSLSGLVADREPSVVIDEMTRFRSWNVRGLVIFARSGREYERTKHLGSV
jgi:hypothetical protein